MSVKSMSALMIVALLAGCTASEGNEQQAAAMNTGAQDIGVLPTNYVAPEPNGGVGPEVPVANSVEPVPAERPVAKLGAISRADLERELESGAGCELKVGGERVLMAVVGDAIARPANSLVHLSASASSYNQLYEGGTFRKGDLSIRIAPLDSHGTKTGEEQSTRRVQVIVNDGGKSEEFSGQWKCGS